MTRRNSATACARARGFTLLELSIVLALIGVMISGGFVTMTASMQARQYNATVARMDDIEKALLNFAVANTRIPCPSDLAQIPTSATYGFEAGASAGGTGTGECVTGMTPAANLKSAAGTEEGGIPSRALQLPDDYMYDGWGRRFRYAVDPTYTKTGALPVTATGCSLPTPNASAITVKDAAGGSRTTMGAYALVSHGANGHGAYTSNGVTVNANITNTDELANCHCASSTGAYSGTYTPSYVQKTPTIDSTSALNSFDDIVAYKEAWQLQGPNFPLVAGPNCIPQYFAVSGNYTYPVLFYVMGSTVTKLPTPATHSTWEWNQATNDFTADNKTLAWGGFMLNSESSGSMVTTAGMLYSVAPAGLTYSATNIPAAEDEKALRISPDGNYMALAGCTVQSGGTCINPFIRLYQKGSTPAFSTITSTSSVNGWAFNTMAWSPDGNTLYGADYANGGQTGASCGVDVYTRSGGTLTYSAALSTPSAMTNNDLGWTRTVAVHPSGNYLAMGGSNGGAYGPDVVKNPLTSPTKISILNSGLPIGSSSAVAFSPDGNYMAATPNDNSIAVYSFNPANAPAYFTAMSVPNNTCLATGMLAFSKDSQYLAAIGSSTTPGLCVFRKNASGTVWTSIFSSNQTGGDVVWSK